MSGHRNARIMSVAVLGFLGVLFVGLGDASAADTAESDADEGFEGRLLSDRFQLRTSLEATAFQTDVAAGRGLGALIRLENLLGFEEEINSWSLRALYRLGGTRQHALRLGYVDHGRTSRASIEGTIPIFDVEFVGVVASEFENQLLALSYQYSFINNGRVETGITAGFATYSFRFSIEGAAEVDGEPVMGGLDRNSGVIAPVPVIGFYTRYAFHRKLILELELMGINLNIGEHSGRILSTEAGLAWFFARHFGVGLAIGATDISYEKQSDDDRLRVDYRQSTVSLNLNLVF
jgi:hypothetical protein